MICPKCGAENTDQVKSCMVCHESLPQQTQVNAESSERKNAGQNISDDTQSTAALSAANEKSSSVFVKQKPVVSLGLNIAIIVVTLVFPIVGIAMGYTYFRKDHPEAKKAGKNWLILGFATLLVNIILINLVK